MRCAGVVWIMLWAGLACAEKLPEDTNAITELTIDQAQQLVSQSKGDLHLRSLNALKEDVAKVLARHKHGLYLGRPANSAEKKEAALETLSDEVAQALSNHVGSVLSLNGVKSLSDKAAEALAQHKGSVLYLGTLESLSDNAARAFAKHRGVVSFAGLATLSDEAARALVQHIDGVSLTGLNRLSDEAISILRENPKIVLPVQFERQP